MRRKRNDRGTRVRFGSGAVAGRGAAEGEPSAFNREVHGVSRSQPERATHEPAVSEHATREHAGAEHGHVPVLSDEVTFLLHPRRGGWVVDGTIGMGGHAEQLLEHAGGDTRLLGIDRDPEALARAARRLARFGARVVLCHGSFRQLGALATGAGVERAAAVLLDLGLSSYQLDESGRGFSFQGAEPLDMRFDPTEGATAAELLGRLSAEEIASLLGELGEERHARRIARVLVEQRRRAPLSTAADLVSVVKRAVPRAAWSKRTHVATRTFQAVRMAVNDEPGALAEALPQAAALLETGGRLGVISFHSGEDRVVKRAFRSLAGRGFVELEPTPVTAGREEMAFNPRARSAKLRVLARQEAA
jgi:16S rRNA (cytosine1402-N4)-methyltransferase